MTEAAKEAVALDAKLKVLDRLSDNINKKAGRSVMGRLSDPDMERKMTIEYIPTPSVDVNDAIGGGFPRGKMTTIAGLPDSGKMFCPNKIL